MIWTYFKNLRLKKNSFLGRLISGSSAAKCKSIKIGDRIIAINGYDTKNLSHEEVVSLIKDSELEVYLRIKTTKTDQNDYKISSKNSSYESLDSKAFEIQS